MAANSQQRSIQGHPRPWRRTALLASMLLLTGCLTDGTYLLSGPGLPIQPGGGPAPPSPAPGGDGPLVPQGRVLQGTAAIGEAAFAGATVNLYRLNDATQVADPVVTGDDGAFAATLRTVVPAGSVLLVTATRGETTLSGFLAAPADWAVQATIPSLRLDLAMTVVTKRILPKLAEALLSESPDEAGRRRSADLFVQAMQLIGAVEAQLAGAVRDARLQAAIDAALAQPTDEAIDGLAAAIVAYGTPRAAFVGLVERAQADWVANLLEGGPGFGPRQWWAGADAIELPAIAAVSGTQVRITYQGRTFTVTLPPSAFARTSPIIEWLEGLLRNGSGRAIPVGGGSSGGGGGGMPPTLGLDTDLTIVDGTDPVVVGTKIVRYAGTGFEGLQGDDGAALLARFYGPSDVTVDAAGNVYVSDTYNLRIRRIDRKTGIITTVAGSGPPGTSLSGGNGGGFSGDGGLATNARLSWTAGIKFDSKGNLYIADSLNHRVRRVRADDQTIETVAGNSATTGLNCISFGGSTICLGPTSGGFSGDGGPATQAAISAPAGLAFDSQDNLYIADALNHRVRRVDAMTGIITTIAGTGTGGSTGDNGQAANARLNNPSGLAFDRSGNLYVSEANGHRVRKIDMGTGVITTAAGGNGAGNDGENVQAATAKLYQPAALAIDHADNLYIGARAANRIRKVDLKTGIITTFAGGGSSGDGGSPLAVNMSSPTGVAVDATGAVFIVERGNVTVRVVRQ